MATFDTRGIGSDSVNVELRLFVPAGRVSGTFHPRLIRMALKQSFWILDCGVKKPTTNKEKALRGETGVACDVHARGLRASGLDRP